MLSLLQCVLGPYVQKEVQEMPKISAKYETIFIVNPTIGEEATNAVVEKFKTLIEANATVDNIDIWGKRRLAYAINDLTEGYYVLVEFTSASDFPAELDRIYTITDGIMRSIIIAKDN